MSRCKWTQCVYGQHSRRVNEQYHRIHEEETTMSQTEMYTLESICVCIHICATCTYVKQQHVACALNTHKVYEQVCLHILKYVSSYQTPWHNSVWYLRAIGSSEALDLYLCGQTSGQGSLSMLVLVYGTASSGRSEKGVSRRHERYGKPPKEKQHQRNPRKMP